MKNEKMQLLEIIGGGGARARPAPIAATGLKIVKSTLLGSGKILVVWGVDDGGVTLDDLISVATT